MEIACGSLLEDIIPGAVFRLDASPVCSVTNPLNHPLKFSGKARCGGKEVAFGPYEVPAGFSKVKLEDDALKVFLNPVESDIVLFDMVLDGVLASDAVPMTKSSGEYVFDITGYIPLEFEAGDEISVSVPLEDVSEVDIKEVADEYGVDVKSFILNVDVVNNAPFELTATLPSSVVKPYFVSESGTPLGQGARWLPLPWTRQSPPARLSLPSLRGLLSLSSFRMV